MQFAIWADAGRERRQLLSAGRHQDLRERAETFHSMVGDVHFRAADHQLRPAGRHREGQDAEGHEEQGRLLGGHRSRPRRAADAEAGRIRLQPRRLHLIGAQHRRRRRRWLPATPNFRVPRQGAVQSVVFDHRGMITRMITWANFVSQLFNGLALGALLALISSGLTIIYGTLGVLNLAHGAMFMLGGYAGCVAYEATGSFVVAVIAGSLFVMVVGVVMERVIIRHFYAPPAGGPAPGDVRARHRLRRAGALFLRQPVADRAAARLGGRHHAARLHDLSDLPPRRARHRRGRADCRSTSCSTARGSA